MAVAFQLVNFLSARGNFHFIFTSDLKTNSKLYARILQFQIYDSRDKSLHAWGHFNIVLFECVFVCFCYQINITHAISKLLNRILIDAFSLKIFSKNSAIFSFIKRRMLRWADVFSFNSTSAGKLHANQKPIRSVS